MEHPLQSLDDESPIGVLTLGEIVAIFSILTFGI